MSDRADTLFAIVTPRGEHCPSPALAAETYLLADLRNAALAMRTAWRILPARFAVSFAASGSGTWRAWPGPCFSARHGTTLGGSTFTTWHT